MNIVDITNREELEDVIKEQTDLLKCLKQQAEDSYAQVKQAEEGLKKLIRKRTTFTPHIFDRNETFGVTSNKNKYFPFYIGIGNAHKGDECKVLILNEDWRVEVLENYFKGQPALKFFRVPT